jgi:uroporphyrinogen decarboxylase
MGSDRFLRALRREPVDRTPVWFMRQAGRYLPEYRQLRGDRDILESIRRLEEAVEITLQPLRRMPVDAAIVFSDIVVPLVAVGLPIKIVPGRGPVLDDPIRDEAGVARLRPLEPEVDEPYVVDAIRLLVKELDVPLIGFAGAPFTLASYLIEGGPSRDHARTKAMLWSEPDVWNDLLSRLVSIVVAHVGAQVDAGASAIQIFDSWVGALAPATYETTVASHMRRLFTEIGELGVPVIHFGVGTGELLGPMAAAGGDAIGVDARVPLDGGWNRVGGPSERAVQGNLDPSALLAPWEVVEREALDVLARADGRDGHVFNLGHGVLPDTPVATLQRLVDLVHERTERSAAP